MNIFKKLTEELKRAIPVTTVPYDKESNSKEVEYIISKLESIGFNCSLHEGSPYHQPAIVALRGPTFNGKNKVCIYNHYDVEPIHRKDWDFPPFKLTEHQERLFGRGIADNKGVLWSRILTLEYLWEQQLNTPSILWLIQGEEEAGAEVAYVPFKNAIQRFQSELYLEETGYHKKDQQLLLIKPYTSETKKLASEIISALEIINPLIEERHLNKSYANKPCPFLTAIPTDGIYLAIGPNYNSRIHKNNESLSIPKLQESTEQFCKLLSYISSNLK